MWSDDAQAFHSAVAKSTGWKGGVPHPKIWPNPYIFYRKRKVCPTLAKWAGFATATRPCLPSSTGTDRDIAEKNIYKKLKVHLTVIDIARESVWNA
jgi:hypothetical protein